MDQFAEIWLKPCDTLAAAAKRGRGARVAERAEVDMTIAGAIDRADEIQFIPSDFFIAITMIFATMRTHRRQCLVLDFHHIKIR